MVAAQALKPQERNLLSSHTGERILGVPKSWFYITTEEALEASLRVIRAYLMQGTVDAPAQLGFDFETYRPDGDRTKIPRAIWNGREWEGRTRTMQVGTDPHLRLGNIQFIYDVFALGEARLSAAFKDILENNIVLGQNLKYEYQFCYMQYGIDLKYMDCTQLKSQVLRAGDVLGHGLADLYGLHFNRSDFMLLAGMPQDGEGGYEDFKKYFQEEFDWTGPLTEEALRYGADDVRLIFWLNERLNDATDEHVRRFEANWNQEERSILNEMMLEMQCIPALALQECIGFRVDRKGYETEIIPKLKAGVENAKNKLATFPEFRKERKPGQQLVILEENMDLPQQVFKRENAQELKKVLMAIFPKTKFRVNGKGRAASSDTIEIEWTDGPSEKTVGAVALAGTGHTWELANPDLIALKSVGENGQLTNAVRLCLGEVPRDYKGNETTSTKVLKFRVNEHPAIKTLMEFRSASHNLSHFGYGLYSKIDYNDRVHPSWFQIGSESNSVDSGRSSCADPNLMNQPARKNILKCDENPTGVSSAEFFRRKFICAPENLLIVGDFTMLEPTIMALISRDPELRRILCAGEDIHAIAAQEAFRLPYLPSKKNIAEWKASGILGPNGKLLHIEAHEWREKGKIVNLGTQYTMGPPLFREFLFIESDGAIDMDLEEEVKPFFKRWFTRFAGIKAYQDRVAREVVPQNSDTLADFRGRIPITHAFSLYGRPRGFYLTKEQEKIWDCPAETLHRDYVPPGYRGDPRWVYNEWKKRLNKIASEAGNHPVQSTAAGVQKRAILRIFNEYKRRGWITFTTGIVAQVHDEIICEAKKEWAEEALHIQKTSMEGVLNELLKGYVPGKADVHMGPNWFDTKAA